MHTDKDARTWAMVLHLSLLAGYTFAPVAGWIAPIVIWQIKKTEMPEIDVHGKIVVNWLISSLIYGAVCFVLMWFFIGIPLAAALWVMGIVFPIVGAIKANDGIAWKYPLSLNVL